jgi:hypothetical protein
MKKARKTDGGESPKPAGAPQQRLNHWRPQCRPAADVHTVGLCWYDARFRTMAPEAGEKTMAITAVQVQRVAQNNPDGVSIDLVTGRVLTGVGFCVAYQATQNNFDFAGLNASMAHAQGPNGSGIIGAWSHAGTIYYDSVKKYTTRTAAVEAAIEEGQLAIYNLNTLRVEDIMTPGGSFNPSLAAARKRSHTV